MAFRRLLKSVIENELWTFAIFCSSSTVIHADRVRVLTETGQEQKAETDVLATTIQAPQAQERPFTLGLFNTPLFPDLDRRAQDVSSHSIDILWDAA